MTKGASKGEGLGNAFLSHIRAVDGLFQVVRAFPDPEIIHIEGSVDPVRDLQIIHDELSLKDMEFASKALELAEKSVKRNSSSIHLKGLKEELATASKILEHLEEGKRIANGVWTNREVEIINSMSLLTAKPSVYLVNVSEDIYLSTDQSKELQLINEWVKENSPGDSVLPICVNMEHRLAVESVIPEAVRELRRCLGLISFFTCGPKEVREWTIREGTRAPQAAAVIHNDFEKTFINAQVTKFDDAIAAKGNGTELKSTGKLNQKGKDYAIEDGDIVVFKVSQNQN